MLHNMQGQRKKYGIQRYVVGTLHSNMDYILPPIETLLSISDNNYSMWDKGNLLVILSRTKLSEDTFFFGNKKST